VSERIAVSLQYLLPKQALTALAGKFAGSRAGGLTTSVIRWFVGRYGVNMARRPIRTSPATPVSTSSSRAR
jgi:phosphatidylserine decarboxylase